MQNFRNLKYVIIMILLFHLLITGQIKAEYSEAADLSKINNCIENLEWEKAESLLLQNLWNQSFNSLETIEKFVQVCIYLHKAPLGMEWLEKAILNIPMTDDQKKHNLNMLHNLQKIYLPQSKYTLEFSITANNIDLDNPEDLVITENGDLVVMDRYRLITFSEQSPANYLPVPPTSPLPEDVQTLKSIEGKPVIITQNGYYQDHRVNFFSSSVELNRIIDATLSNKGFWLIIDRRHSNMLRFDVAGNFLEAYPVPTLSGNEKIIRNNFGGCWILNPLSRQIITAGSNFEIRIPFKGPGYNIVNPIDIATDWFGHLYVLDKDNAVTIFSPSGIRLRRLLLDPENKFLKEIRAIAIKDDGRIFIADRKKHAIYCYH